MSNIWNQANKLVNAYLINPIIYVGVYLITFPTITSNDIFVLVSASQTLLNKKLSDSTTYIVAALDTTKRIGFSLTAQTTGTTTTFISTSTGTRNFTLPDKTTNIMGNDTTDTMINKLLSDSTCKFANVADITKLLLFSLGGATTGKTLTLISSHTNNRSITYPDATTLLVGNDTTEALTNKTSLTFAGSNQSALSIYEEATTVSGNFSGAISSASFSLRLSLSGKTVTCEIPIISGACTVTASNISSAVGLIPSRFRPKLDAPIQCRIVTASANVGPLGLIIVNTAGTVIIYQDATLATNWTNGSGNCGAYASYGSWLVT